MTAPTTYFPDVLYKIGFQPSRRWSTRVSPEGPSGRVQRFKEWTTPKRRLTLTVLGLGGTSFSVSATTIKTVRNFLYGVAGRYGSFYIFNPRAEDYDHLGDPQQTLVGTYSAWPMVCPFKGGTIATVYDDGVALSTFGTDSNGAGGETRITTSSPTPGAGSIITVDVTGAKERIPVIQLKDTDDFAFDWTAAQPPTEIALDLEEDFG
jgi:hypothetical protein